MFCIGIDIGGTKIRAVLWNGKKVIRAREVPTPKNKNDFQKRLVALVSSLRRHDVEAIGIGAAGIVKGTVLLSSPNIPYIKNFVFRPLWPRSIRLRVDNDARAFARAKLLRGAGHGAKSIFALTIGTGIGRAYGKNGKIAKIKKLEYPERWERTYQAIRRRRNDPVLANFLGKNLARLMKPFKPEVIVVGGGVLERRGFLKRLRKELKARGLPYRIRRTRLTKNAVAIGAALLCTG